MQDVSPRLLCGSILRWIRPAVCLFLTSVASAQGDRDRVVDPVPEIDGSTARAAITLLVLGTLMLVSRVVRNRPATSQAQGRGR